MKKIISLGLVIMMCTALGVTAFAQENDFQKETEAVNAEGMQTISESEREELETESAEEFVPESNIMEHTYSGEVSQVTEELIEKKNKRDIAENIDPNYAYLVENDYLVQGNLTAVNEMRWYAFQANEKSKITILLEMVESVDADLYLFKLDGSTLNLVGGSSTEGLGGIEYTTQVVEAGIYYFAIASYNGTGNYIFGFYQSSLDANNEVNDTQDMATNIDFGAEITGVIDNVNDHDYYKLVLPRRTFFRFSYTDTNGYVFGYLGSDNGNTIYKLEGTDIYDAAAGTYYFRVRSNGEKNYSATSPYTIKFNKLGNVADDSSANFFAYNEKAGIILQANQDASKCYINGNRININYSYYDDCSNDAGTQVYDISIQQRDDVKPLLQSRIPNDSVNPKVAWYHGSSRPAMKINSKYVLEMWFLSTTEEDFYFINCFCTGAYAQNYYWKNYAVVDVIIDPDTGRLVDIADDNYFYGHAVGDNKMTLSSFEQLTYLD